MSTALPVAVSGWLLAYRNGARPHDLLAACLDRAREGSTATSWIHLASDAELAAQIKVLDGIEAGLPDRAALLARYPLFGVPFAVKDNIDIAGVATTAGCPAWRYVADKSAAAVARLIDAGAVWIGKTNLDQFATGLVGTRSPYGQPSSVFSADHISGGSSSGSAVVVANGTVAFSLGTDTAGSGRVPAGFNQIVGLKPTPGRVGGSGVVPACRSLDCVSVFALTVDDAAHVLSVMEGPDADDIYSRFEPGPAAWCRKPLRIGVPRELRLAPGSDYAQAFSAACDAARALGHELVAVDFDVMHRTAALLYPGPWVAERYSVVQSLIEKDPDAIDPVVREVIGAAAKFSAADLFRALYQLRLFQQQAAHTWNPVDGVDVLLVPSAPRHPTFAEIAADPVGVNGSLGVYTNFVNLLGWSALALPAGTTPGGLPFGITFIADGNHDAALAALGREWQCAVPLPLGATGVALTDLDGGAMKALRAPAAARTLPLAVVGAHLSGMPLNGQLLERCARLLEATQTAPHYTLYALPNTTPPKPGLMRTTSGGSAIELEVWDVPIEHVGSFLALVPPPLGLGSVELADGRWVKGFICEAHAIDGARDISSFGGWRAYIRSLAKP